MQQAGFTFNTWLRPRECTIVSMQNDDNNVCLPLTTIKVVAKKTLTKRIIYCTMVSNQHAK